jgi:hypothetical protein
MDWCECWRTGEEEEGKSHLCAISQRSVFCAGGRAGGTITGIGTNLPARRATESGKAIRGRVGDAVAIHAGFGRDPALGAREPEEPGTDLDEGRRIHPSAQAEGRLHGGRLVDLERGRAAEGEHEEAEHPRVGGFSQVPAE